MIEKKATTIAVVNGKGGCGKTTLVTNLAAYFALKEFMPTVVDYDPQASSSRWLQARPSHCCPIHSINLSALSRSGGFSRSWQFHVPHNTTRVILDTPAGVSGVVLDEVLQRAQVLVIPVLPSAHDVRATARFIADLLLNIHYRRYRPSVCVVANRVDKGTLVFGKLQRFLYSLDIPFVATFSNNRYYLQAAEKGVGICEISTRLNEGEMEEWHKLVRWIDKNIQEKSAFSNGSGTSQPDLKNLNQNKINLKEAMGASMLPLREKSFSPSLSTNQPKGRTPLAERSSYQKGTPLQSLKGRSSLSQGALHTKQPQEEASPEPKAFTLQSSKRFMAWRRKQEDEGVKKI